ncbi:MAG: nitronate monooxygenase [Thermodesulfobacteriota bacterium]|nr:nitronate monooxygenase [Thermodesulfobacteriota bacterium]
MFNTAITRMFGIEYPIICGAMMWLSKPGLCAAISNAGGMGNLTAGNYDTADEFRAAIHEVRTLTDKPFMVGVTILPSVRITSEHHAMYIRVCTEEKVAGIEVSGAPLDSVVGMEGIEGLKKAGVRLFHKVGSLRHARHAEKVGYDGVYAAGFEEGGHPLDDDVSTMVLTPRIAEAVSIPVVTVGGICDGRSMAAAMTLGAQGVMMGSRFIATKECVVHENIKNVVVNGQENDTTIFGKPLGLQGRAFKNDLISRVRAIEENGGGFDEIIPLISGQKIRDAWAKGNVEDASLMIGQSIGRIHDIVSCKDLLKGMHDNAIKHLDGARAFIK